MKTLRIACLAVVLVIPAFTSGGASLPSQVEGHLSGMMAKVTLADGSSRTVRLEGVGCSESMCSRVFISSASEAGVSLRTWIDSIASIKDATDNDALFVMRDGTERRLVLLPSFRVLYVSGRTGGTEKLDLTKIRALEFAGAGK
jgi:hypothetical protein